MLILLLCSVSLPAQTPFQKGFDAGGAGENGWGMDADGNDFVVTGSIKSAADPGDIMFMKVNTSGTASTPVRITGPNEEWGRDIKAEPAGAYVIAGGARDGNGNSSPVLVQLTPSGAIQWTSAYRNGNFGGSFNSVAAVSNYAYCAAGYSENMLTNGADLDGLIVIASNNTGSMLAGNTFGGVNDDAFHQVIALSNGNYLAVGMTESFGTQGKGMYLVVVDSTGSKVWSRVLDGPGDDIAYAAVEDSFGISFVGQTNSYNMDNRTDACLGRFQLNGQFLSLNVYENSAHQDGARGVAYVPNDGYIISGTTLDTDSTAWLMRLTPNFGVSWYRQYKGIALRDVEQLSNGNTFLAVGSHLAPGANRNDLYVVHADNMGGTGSTCTDPSITPTSTVQLPMPTLPADTILSVNQAGAFTATAPMLQVSSYDACTFVGIENGLADFLELSPNPSNGLFMLKYDLGALEAATLQVFDLQGRAVYENSLGLQSAGQTQIDLTALPSSTYLLRLQAGEQTWSRKLLVR